MTRDQDSPSRRSAVINEVIPGGKSPRSRLDFVRCSSSLRRTRKHWKSGGDAVNETVGFFDVGVSSDSQPNPVEIRLRGTRKAVASHPTRVFLLASASRWRPRFLISFAKLLVVCSS